MTARYCDSGGSRAAAWQPWAGLGGIAKSEALYQEMLTPGLPPFAKIGLVDGIEDTGGMQPRTCLVGGQSLACWYVDPARAQGANWWATDDPTGGAVGSGEAPLTAPFYVIARGDGFEERYWMSVDAGYPVNISARRTLGENARPRDGHPASGLEWWQGADLCDTARPEMGCVPPPPAPEPAPEAPPPAAAPHGPRRRGRHAARRHAGVAARRAVLDARHTAVLRPLAGRGRGLTTGPVRAGRF
jgi:hypothetical protein